MKKKQYGTPLVIGLPEELVKQVKPEGMIVQEVWTHYRVNEVATVHVAGVLKDGTKIDKQYMLVEVEG